MPVPRTVGPERTRLKCAPEDQLRARADNKPAIMRRVREKPCENVLLRISIPRCVSTCSPQRPKTLLDGAPMVFQGWDASSSVVGYRKTRYLIVDGRINIRCYFVAVKQSGLSCRAINDASVARSPRTMGVWQWG